jgi:catechol 2,3-dioxygenase-like lactoylglutathione lyase family enzyme
MITGTHAIIYAKDAERARAFFRDVLELPHVDAHDGWLIFKLPPAELGVHPAGVSGEAGAGAPSGHHELYLMCDDIEATVTELTTRGVEFTTPVEAQGFGLLTRLRVPGAGEIGIYQPRHPTAYDLDSE